MISEEIYENIDKLSEIARGFMKSEILLVANELNIFSLIGKKGKSLDDICRETGINRRAMKILLNALMAMKFIDMEKDFYLNSSLSCEYLLPGKEFYQGNMLKHLYKTKGRWADLLDIVKTGKPLKTGSETRKKSEDETRRFILGMSNVAAASVEKLLPLLDLSGIKHLLDVGGGPATYSTGFCKKYPGLRATVFDLPEVIPITKEQLTLAGMEESIDTIAGDFMSDEFGGPYDMVFISNIIHMLGPDKISGLFQKSAKCLEPGGKIAVKDFFVDNDLKGPEYSLLFAVNMLVSTEEGNTYTEREVIDMLSKSGFREFEFKTLTPHTKIVTAIKS